MDEVYTNQLVKLAVNMKMAGRLDSYDGSAHAESKLCGSDITVFVRLDANRRVNAFAHELDACALGQAATSAMEQVVIGSSLAELETLRDKVKQMLAGENVSFEPKWKIIELLQPIRQYKARHSSALLPFNATVAAVAEAVRAADKADKKKKKIFKNRRLTDAPHRHQKQ